MLEYFEVCNITLPTQPLEDGSRFHCGVGYSVDEFITSKVLPIHMLSVIADVSEQTGSSSKWFQVNDTHFI